MSELSSEAVVTESGVEIKDDWKEHIEQGDELCRVDVARDHSKEKFSIASEKGNEAARIGLITLIKNGRINDLEQVIHWATVKLDTFDAEEVIEEADL